MYTDAKARTRGTVLGSWHTEVQHQRQACIRTAPACRHGFRLEYLQGLSSSPPNGESMNYIQNALLCERSQSVFLRLCVGAHVHFSPAVLTSGQVSDRALESLGFVILLTLCSNHQSSLSRCPGPVPCPLCLQPMQGRGAEATLTLP